MDIKILEKIIRIFAYIIIIDFILLIGYAAFGIFIFGFEVFLVLLIILGVCIPIIFVLGLIRNLQARKTIPSRITDLEEVQDKTVEAQVFKEFYLLANKGDISGAEKVIDSYLAQNPRNIKGCALKAMLLISTERSEEALNIINKELEYHPQSYELWYNKGIALMRLGREQEALDCSVKAKMLKPGLNIAEESKKLATGADYIEESEINQKPSEGSDELGDHIRKAVSEKGRLLAPSELEAVMTDFFQKKLQEYDSQKKKEEEEN
ncbi:MAG: hypothetical protein ACFFGP_11440 [Promethearchaeota archaeon]